MNGIREKIFCNLLRKSKSKNGEKFWSIFFNFYCHFILGFEFSPQTQVGEIFQLYTVHEEALLIRVRLLEIIA